jgi:hypothetical protein
MPQPAFPSARSRPSAEPSDADRQALLREAEAHCALAELFPHLQPLALRAIQELFPLARPGADAANEATAH